MLGQFFVGSDAWIVYQIMILLKNIIGTMACVDPKYHLHFEQQRIHLAPCKEDDSKVAA